MELTHELRENAGLQWVLERLSPLSPFGKQAARTPRWYGPGEEAALEEELDNVALAMELWAAGGTAPQAAEGCGCEAPRVNPADLKDAAAALRGVTRCLPLFHDIRGSFDREPGTPFDLVELFEIKHFLVTMEQVTDAYAKMPALAGIAFPPLTEAMALMDPEGRRLPTFSIVNSYHNDLAPLRVEKAKLEKAIRMTQEDKRGPLLEKRRVLAVQEDQLEELKKTNQEYELSDIVGRTGIEASMELELQGHKGYKNLVVNNVGNVMQVLSETQASTGNDIYLTIDRDLQIGIYHLIEQQLAGIVSKALVNQDVDTSAITDSSKISIPVKDAYYQLINNNVLSLSHMASEDATDIERQIQSIYTSSREQILERLRYELMSDHPTMMKDLPQDMMAYMAYIYNWLSDSTIGIVQKDRIDQNSESYQAWKNDEISLRDYIYAGISESWIDTTKLNVTNKYSSADDIYQVLVDYVLEHLKDDAKFTKRIYRYLINDQVVTGRQLCLALYAQGVLPYDANEVQLLTANGEEYAFQFIRRKIQNIELTPAQLALDPCTGGVVITDVNTGEVRALVTYPSYDNNRLSGSADPAYMRQLQEDLSLPLYNNATQAKKAPGSTFKPITAIAGLEEKVIGLYETIDCTGEYKEVDPPIKCWIYPGHHGPLTVVGGLQNSCNYFFSEVAHRLATNRDTLVYSTDMGVDTIRRYASMFGLNRPSGIEISETTPELTTEDPERSAMGQGTNSYSNVQLSRYVAAIANSGTVFDLSLLDKMTDSEGNLIQDFTPEATGHVDIADSTWDAVHQGMRAVITDGSVNKIFKDLEVEIAGKTGTAQESRTRGNHAFFISYGPYTNPEICVTVNIPYGYSSSNAAMVAKNVYRFYYGYTDLESILGSGALEVSNVKVGD